MTIDFKRPNSSSRSLAEVRPVGDAGQITGNLKKRPLRRSRQLGAFMAVVMLASTIAVAAPPAAVAAPTCGGEMVTVDIAAGQRPTAGADVIFGTNGPDTIRALGGNDIICGRGGADQVWGGNGNDTLYGQDGNDTLNGGSGDDELRGGTGADTINGDYGRDRLYGQAGGDKLYGGPNADIIYGGPNDDRAWGDDGNDTLYGQEGNDTLYGGNGNDEIIGSAGNDSVRGQNGTDDCTAETERRCLTDDGTERVAKVVAALEAYATDHGTFVLPGGWNNTGRGWFALSNGTSYPAAIAETLLDGGYLQPDRWRADPHELLVYQCGDRAAVFAETDAEPSRAARTQWEGCTQGGGGAGLEYFDTTRTVAQLQRRDTRPPGRVTFDLVESYWDAILVSWQPTNDNVGVDRYEIMVDGSVVDTIEISPYTYLIDGLDGASFYQVGVRAVDAAGNRGPVTPRTFGTDYLVPLPTVKPYVTWRKSNRVLVRWGSVSNDPNVEAIGIFVDGTAVEWLDPQMNSYAITGLAPDTDYSIGVYPVSNDYNPRTTNKDIKVRTQLGDNPPTQPTLGIWDWSDTSVTVKWGYSDGGTPISADDTRVAHYDVVLDGQVVGERLSSESRSYTFDGLWPNTTYKLQVVAVDEDGQIAASPIKTQRTKAPILVPDTRPPADIHAPIWGSGVKPPRISVDLHKPTSVDISWCCALDYDQYDVVPASFDVYLKLGREGANAYKLIRTVAAYDTGGSTSLSRYDGAPLVTNTRYSVRIVAVDRAGNRSEALERHDIQPRSPNPDEPKDEAGSLAPDPQPWKNPPPPEPGSTGDPIPTAPVEQAIPPSDIIDVADDPWACRNAGFIVTSDQDQIRIKWRNGPGGVFSYRGTARKPSEMLSFVRPSVTSRSPMNISGLQPDTDYSVSIEAFGINQSRLGKCSFSIVTAEEVAEPPADPTPANTAVGTVGLCLVRSGAIKLGLRYETCFVHDFRNVYSTHSASVISGLSVGVSCLKPSTFALLFSGNIRLSLLCLIAERKAIVTSNATSVRPWRDINFCKNYQVGWGTWVAGPVSCDALDEPRDIYFEVDTITSSGPFLESNYTNFRLNHMGQVARGRGLYLAHQELCANLPAHLINPNWCEPQLEIRPPEIKVLCTDSDELMIVEAKLQLRRSSDVSSTRLAVWFGDEEVVRTVNDERPTTFRLNWDASWTGQFPPTELWVGWAPQDYGELVSFIHNERVYDNPDCWPF